MAEASVRVSGIVFTSMMYQHVNCDSDVEGLMVGQATVSEQVTISDSQTDNIHVEETFNVRKLVCCHRLHQFYSSVGDVDVDSLKKIMADERLEDLVGWYRQRRNSEQQVTLREKQVHESLMRATSNPNMVFMLLTPSEVTLESSTHRVEYSAFISRQSQFVNVPVTIHNLGVLDQPPYWTSAPMCSAAGYNRTITRHKSRFFSAPEHLRDVSEMNRMNESLQSELQNVCGTVAESEHRVGALQVEVSDLRRKVREKKRLQVKDADLPVEKGNRLLQDAVRALFFPSPLYRTQTLTLDGSPVPDQSCGTEPLDQAAPETNQGDPDTVDVDSDTNIEERLGSRGRLRSCKRSLVSPAQKQRCGRRRI
ncbi:BRCA1-A complex subunit Abraxas 1 isoform X1 [Synchiropus splendidus]|uniref:BRCA1-A complex subunit Abraxas 1 isoform X1 n=2 Tax=Synchiropus splendidus TaxID=270530 RepID=UPI00237EBDE0|nr:BRCA1-A complex subunit Abraxas 1 isoform X1 [Synchiropus splendidus]